MGLTTERKVYVGLVAIAGLILIIDQGFLGPKQASADQVPIPASTSDDAGVVNITPTHAEKSSAAILIDRLRSKGSSNMSASLGSSFSLAKLIKPHKSTSASTNQGEAVGQESYSSDALPMFAPKASDLPVLSSVMPSKTGGGAVLGGKLVRIGQLAPNGYRLVLVHARSVLVERDGVQYAIEIPTISDRH